MEVDQHVPAQDQVEVRELKWRGAVQKAQQVVPLETHQRAELPLHLPLVLACIGEVALSLLLRHGAKRPFAESRLPGRFQEAVVDVGSDDADAPGSKVLAEKFIRQNRKGIWLGPSSASGTPDPQPSRGGLPGDDFRQNGLAQGCELLRVAEEQRLADGDLGL